MNNEQQKYVGWEAVQTPVPRLRIRTDEGEHFLIPWHMISLIKADLSLKNGRTAYRLRIAFLHCFPGSIAEFAIPSASRMCPGGISRRWREN